jgi:hypothetical protein
LLLLTAMAVSGCTAPPTPAPAGAPTAVVPTRSDAPPTREATPVLAAPLPAGTVVVEPGPFTDRLTFAELALRPGEQPAVTGRVANAVDVSELIVLTLRADYYDAGGRLLGSGTATYADEEFAGAGATPIEHDHGPGAAEHAEPVPVTVPSTDRLPGAVSAVLSVPQLVNE